MPMNNGLLSMAIELEPAGIKSMQEGNSMATNQFADISKDLYMQIKVVENLVKGDLYNEAGKLLSTAEEACNNLESLMTPENAIQTRIIDNRRREIRWIQDAIQYGLAKAQSKPAKKRVTKSK